MGSVVLTFDKLSAPLQRLGQWCIGSSRVVRPRVAAPAAATMVTTGSHTQLSRAAPSKTVPRGTTRPLRVLRVVDACHPPASAGRMVISGRLADVCAELDRLAAAEVLH